MSSNRFVGSVVLAFSLIDYLLEEEAPGCENEEEGPDFQRGFRVRVGGCCMRRWFVRSSWFAGLSKPRGKVR